MPISRQHAETRIVELSGWQCEHLLALPSEYADVITVLYLKADGLWFRFFIDAGVLFFDECDGPDPEDDLSPGEQYCNVGDKCGCSGDVIELIDMRNKTLRIAFASGRMITLSEQEDGETRLNCGCVHSY